MTAAPSLDRARAAVAGLPPSISGAGGHAALFRAACTAIGYGASPEDAVAILASEFNPRCSPPWGMADLRHKVADAAKTVAPRPYSPRLNDGPPPEEKRKRWPEFRPPTKAELRAIGELRNVSPEGLALALARGILWAAHVRGFDCWLVTDARRLAAQARRLDGQPFEIDAEPKKAFTLPGSQCDSPVGFDAVADFPAVMFCEGGPDLLAAFHFLAIENRAADCHAVAMLGANHNIGEQHAPAFAGKRVRFYPHLDKAGRCAVARWARAIKPHASKMDAVNFASLRTVDGSQVTDLNDCCFVDADCFEEHRILWNLAP